MSRRPSKASLERLDDIPSLDGEDGRPSGSAVAERTVPGPVRMRGQLSLHEKARSFSIEIRSGEVLGVAGLEGHGGAALLETLVGLRPPVSGSMGLVSEDGSTKPVRSYIKAVRDGIAYVPGNRQTEGLFAPLSVVDNMLMATLSTDAKLGLFRMRRLTERTRSFVQRLDVEVADIRDPVDLLSGGNQQKVLVGRWLAAEPRVLVMNDPLRGVDLGTKRQFYRLLRELAGGGVAVVLLSTEIEELVQVCDRTAVFREHSTQAVLERHQLGYDEILKAMFDQGGAHDEGGAA
jgi:ribose transport system ATP-binding protein